MQSQDHSYAYHSAPPSDCPKEGWKRAEVQKLTETAEVARRVEAEMTALGYVRKDTFAVTLVLREAVANAVRHGHRGDKTRNVLIHYHVGPEGVFVEVADEGCGFDPHLVSDPLDENNQREQPPRWGLLLMRVYMSWIRFNKRGNRVLLCKQRSQGSATPGP
jgi:anti-sigma regulatory factor (Ser/Thr protein kinase)